MLWCGVQGAIWSPWGSRVAEGHVFFTDDAETAGVDASTGTCLTTAERGGGCVRPGPLVKFGWAVAGLKATKHGLGYRTHRAPCAGRCSLLLLASAQPDSSCEQTDAPL
jgi:hypothetical protein